MELGMIGLGQIGTNMVQRLRRAGHPCVVCDLRPEAVQALVKEGAVGTTSLGDFAKTRRKPRAVWIMVPAALVDATPKTLIPFLERDDVFIDGGNSDDQDSRGEDDFADEMLSALRYEFGGHEEKAAVKKGGA